MIEPLRSNEKKSGNKFNQSGEKCGTHNTRKPTRQNNTNIMPENLTNLVFCMSYLQKSKYYILSTSKVGGSKFFRGARLNKKIVTLFQHFPRIFFLELICWQQCFSHYQPRT